MVAIISTNTSTDNFQPDNSLKKLFRSLTPKQLVALVNALLKTKYHPDSDVFFENTENHLVTGSLDQSSVRGDLIICITEPNSNVSDKVVIEFQSTPDNSMGFRMFLYCFNVVDKKNNIYALPKGITIYTTGKKVKSGFDTFKLQLENFRVNNTNYSSKNNDLLEIDFPFINITAMTIEELEQADLDIFKIIYPYRYKLNPSFLKTDELNISKILNNIYEKTKNLTDEQYTIASEILTNLLTDITNKYSKNKKFEKVMKTMQNAKLTYADEIRLETWDKAWDKAWGEAKKQTTNEILIQQVLDLKDDFTMQQIQRVTKLSIEEIQTIIDENSKN